MWQRALYLVALFAGAAMAAGASRWSGAVNTRSGEAFWRCPSGYTFETSGTAVHCKRAAWTETRPVVDCAVQARELKVDLVGTTDMCGADLETTCAPGDITAGFTKRRVSGRDFCGKTHRPDVIAPNERVLM